MDIKSLNCFCSGQGSVEFFMETEDGSTVQRFLCKTCQIQIENPRVYETKPHPAKCDLCEKKIGVLYRGLFLCQVCFDKVFCRLSPNDCQFCHKNRDEYWLDLQSCRREGLFLCKNCYDRIRKHSFRVESLKCKFCSSVSVIVYGQTRVCSYHFMIARASEK